MAFTTEFVMGAGGGVEVQSQAVSWNTAPSAEGSTTTVATINFGKVGNWRLVLVGGETGFTGSFSNRGPELVIDGATIGSLPSANGVSGGSLSGAQAALTGKSTATVAVKRNRAGDGYASVWSGTAYWWPED